MNTPHLPKKGTDINVEIESLAFGGMGIAKYNGIVVFVKNSIPGQIAKVRITKKKSGFLEARIIEVLTKSIDEIDYPCEHFTYCGGCSFQNMAYDKQLEQKERQVYDLFVRIGNFKNRSLANKEQKRLKYRIGIYDSIIIKIN